MPGGPKNVVPPREGFWRIGRGADPLIDRRPDPETLTSSQSGNRFDSRGGDFGVLYFGADLEACFGETLARFRPQLGLLALIQEEWEKLGFMPVGSVPAEWRQRRTAVRVRVMSDARFLDLEDPQTIQFLRKELALGISALGYQDLDVGLIRGPDRRVTRLIADWAFNAAGQGESLYGGIRYLSRINSDWVCWAVFHDVELEVVDKQPITVSMPALEKVAKLFELTVH